jgi:hypothetical protein
MKKAVFKKSVQKRHYFLPNPPKFLCFFLFWGDHFGLPGAGSGTPIESNDNKQEI